MLFPGKFSIKLELNGVVSVIRVNPEDTLAFRRKDIADAMDLVEDSVKVLEDVGGTTCIMVHDDHFIQDKQYTVRGTKKNGM